MSFGLGFMGEILAYKLHTSQHAPPSVAQLRAIVIYPPWCVSLFWDVDEMLHKSGTYKKV